MKRLLFTYKYQPYVSDLTKLLSELCYEGIIQHEFCMQRLTSDSLLIPIPLHKKKYKKRGYNHTLLLATALSKRVNISVSDVLVRTKATTSQFLLKRDERMQNVKDVFVLMEGKKEDIKGKRIFLLDDVVTTGATVKEAAKILKQSGAKEVYALTLAHGQ